MRKIFTSPSEKRFPVNNSCINLKGYVGEGIGGSLLTVLAAGVDTVALPITVGSYMSGTDRNHSKSSIKGIHRLENNLSSGYTEIRLKHKYFVQIENALTETYYR